MSSPVVLHYAWKVEWDGHRTNESTRARSLIPYNSYSKVSLMQLEISGFAILASVVTSDTIYVYLLGDRPHVQSVLQATLRLWTIENIRADKRLPYLYLWCANKVYMSMLSLQW